MSKWKLHFQSISSKIMNKTIIRSLLLQMNQELILVYSLIISNSTSKVHQIIGFQLLRRLINAQIQMK